MKIKRKNVEIFFQLMLFMLPVGLFEIPGASFIWYGMLACSIFVFLIKKWGKLRNNILNKTKSLGIVVLLMLYMMMQALATFLNSGNPSQNILSAFVVLFLCLFISCYMEEDDLGTIKIFKNVIFNYLCIEIVLYLIFDASLLGTIQCSYLYYIVWATLSFYLSVRNRSRNKEILLFTIIFVLALIMKPQIGDDGNANYEWTFFVIGLLFCIASIFEKTLVKVRKFFTAKIVVIILFAMNMIFVVFQVQDKSQILSYIIVNIMHKDISLTGRSYIWKFARGIILQKPLWGYGTGLIGMRESGYWFDFIRIYGPHNQFLYIILAGGIVTLGAYLVFVLSVFRKLDKAKKTEYTFIFCMGLFGIYLELLVTYRTIANCMPVFALMLIISCMCSGVLKDKQKISIHI